MRIGEWDCDEVCKGCEKENEPDWCFKALRHLVNEVINKKEETWQKTKRR